MATENKGAKGRNRTVNINPIPQIHFINGQDRVERIHAEKYSNKVTHDFQESSKLFYVFYSNVTSLSPQAKDYLFSLPEEVKALALVELHKDYDTVANVFQSNNYSVAYTAPEQTQFGGTHGGELVAVKSHIESRQIDSDILDKIATHFNAPLRFAAKNVKFHSLNLLLVSVYLWCSEGFSERNNVILQQIQMLKMIAGLPLLCIGDFNLTYEEFDKSGWCARD